MVVEARAASTAKASSSGVATPGELPSWVRSAGAAASTEPAGEAFVHNSKP